MGKQSAIYVLLSILCVCFSKYFYSAVVYIDWFYTKMSHLLAPVFSSSHVGVWLCQILTLMLIPLVLVGVPALIYRSIKGEMMPYFFKIVWLVWLIVALSNVLIS